MKSDTCKREPLQTLLPSSRGSFNLYTTKFVSITLRFELLLKLQPLQRQCTYMFADAFTGTPVPNVEATNTVYDGWDVKLNRQFFANGHREFYDDLIVPQLTH